MRNATLFSHIAALLAVIEISAWGQERAASAAAAPNQAAISYADWKKDQQKTAPAMQPAECALIYARKFEKSNPWESWRALEKDGDIAKALRAVTKEQAGAAAGAAAGAGKSPSARAGSGADRPMMTNPFQDKPEDIQRENQQRQEELKRRQETLARLSPQARKGFETTWQHADKAKEDMKAQRKQMADDWDKQHGGAAAAASANPPDKTGANATAAAQGNNTPAAPAAADPAAELARCREIVNLYWNTGKRCFDDDGAGVPDRIAVYQAMLARSPEMDFLPMVKLQIEKQYMAQQALMIYAGSLAAKGKNLEARAIFQMAAKANNGMFASKASEAEQKIKESETAFVKELQDLAAKGEIEKCQMMAALGLRYMPGNAELAQMKTNAADLDPCPACKGTGKCPDCHGTGKTSSPEWAPCPDCGGKGIWDVSGMTFKYCWRCARGVSVAFTSKEQLNKALSDPHKGQIQTLKQKPCTTCKDGKCKTCAGARWNKRAAPRPEPDITALLIQWPSWLSEFEKTLK
ncbi:MAG: hypothetical protein NTX50_01410 [Candidatus Sumerlaeota bacterium]|nr:hypothetical protein [Candidatus Sumerlaeota bacterium]